MHYLFLHFLNVKFSYNTFGLYYLYMFAHIRRNNNYHFTSYLIWTLIRKTNIYSLFEKQVEYIKVCRDPSKQWILEC